MHRTSKKKLPSSQSLTSVVLRVPRSLHRKLAADSCLNHVSMNRLIVNKLKRFLADPFGQSEILLDKNSQAS